VKTILHVTDWANGGLATYLYSIMQEQKKNYHIKLLASADMSESRLTVDEDFIALKNYSRTPMGIYNGYRQTRLLLKLLRPDVIYVHSSFAGLFARLATLSLPFHPKVIYCAHGWPFLMKGSSLKSFIYAKVEKGLAYFSDIIITISKKENEAAMEIGIPPKKLYLIQHGISIKCDLKNLSFKDAQTFNSDCIHILFLGRYDYQKGFDWLIDFIKKNSTPNICWHIAGKSIVNETMNIPKDVINHGWVEHKDIGQLLLRCDALIMPSRWEGFGLSAIEAMKYSKPILASYNGALPELIEDNYNGKLFHLENPEELVNFLNTTDKDKLAQLGKYAHDSFLKNYTEDKMFDKLNRLISS
jgi:glycosyltransferase involved in cell wall biosynthesis